MKIRKEWIGSKKPATLGNLADLQEDIHSDLTQMEERMSKKFATKEIVATILTIVKSIDKRLRDWADIPERLTKVENDVFKLKLRR